MTLILKCACYKVHKHGHIAYAPIFYRVRIWNSGCNHHHLSVSTRGSTFPMSERPDSSVYSQHVYSNGRSYPGRWCVTPSSPAGKLVIWWYSTL